MKDTESPRAMFEAIHVHWATLPRFVVYDNSCHALTYALDCEPEWFRATQWVIDATHFLGHIGCACAFDIKRKLCLPDLNKFVSSRRVFWLIVLVRFVFYLGIGHYLPSVSQHRSLSVMCGMQNPAGTGAEAILMCVHEAADNPVIYVCTSGSLLMALMLHVTCSGSR